MAIKFGRPLEKRRLAPVETEAPSERLDLASPAAPQSPCRMGAPHGA